MYHKITRYKTDGMMRCRPHNAEMLTAAILVYHMQPNRKMMNKN